MKVKLFCTYDSKVEEFSTPWHGKTEGDAIRSFAQGANDPQTILYKHPGDFTLFCVGEMDLDKGLLIPLATPKSLGLALDYKKESNEVVPLNRAQNQ